jgi:DNA-binding CsgD family transcriptional regulator
VTRARGERTILAMVGGGPGIILFDERGHLREATAAAERLLALADERVDGALRVLAGRLALGDSAVVTLPTAGTARLRLTGARAGRDLTAVVELQDAPHEAPQATRFTRRESEVLDQVVQGLCTKQIAKRLAISPWTVQQHLGSMFAKAGVTTRAELTALVHTQVRQAA